MHLALFVTADGIHHGGWRHPQASGADQSFGFYRRLAAQAEAAKLDMLFVADKLAVDDLYGNHFATTVRYRASRGTEPLTLLSALAVTTERIGLGGTISTSYTEPYHVARMFASIDHLSGGRAAWNAVTSVSDAEAHNFGRAEHYDHATRYDRAAEYLDVVRRLWDTWEEDAIAPDKGAGIYGDPAKVHYADHAGKWFDVKGPLSLPRPPQGHPVLIQAGASGAFQDLATRNAEVVFAVYPDIDRAKAGYRSFKDDVAAAGRSPDAVKILPGMVPIIADSDDAAADLLGELDALVEPLAGLSFMSGSMNYDLAGHAIDDPVPDIRDFIRGSKGRFHYVIGKAIEEGWTFADLGRWYGSSLSFAKMIGSPRTVADQMEHWLIEEACDGFVVMPAFMPAGVDRMLRHVVPLLQAQGVFRRDYASSTLRGHLGLAHPANSFHRQGDRS
ncbi:MAG: LLM class flavin-dependent oxidoreductase [Sphingomonas sp.]|nr:MAG: LLM class flavin-dependent oxidoreductase [Sphingomonas sp.]